MNSRLKTRVLTASLIPLSVLVTGLLVDGIFFVLNRSPLKQSVRRRDERVTLSTFVPTFEIRSVFNDAPLVSAVSFGSSREGIDSEFKEAGGNFFDSLPSGIPGPGPNASVRHIGREKKSRRQAFDVTYHIDQFRRRVTPMGGLDRRKQHALFFGCSLTFGVNSPDDQTIPYWVSALRPELTAYNNGVSGYGVNDLLARARGPKDGFWEGIREESGVGLYLFIPDHIKRLYGSMEFLRNTGWAPLAYIKEGRNGDPEVAGTFNRNRPLVTGLYRLLSQMELTHFFNLEFPASYSEKDWRFFGKVVVALRQEYLNRFPLGRFIVVMLPWGDGTQWSQLASQLESQSISYLNYARHDISELMREPAYFGDYHYTPATNRKIAEFLSRDLERYLGMHPQLGTPIARGRMASHP